MLENLIWLVIAALVVFLVIKLLKKVVKIVFTLILLAIIVLGVFTFLIYKDANEFKDKIVNEDSLYLLKDNNELLTGLIFKTNEDDLPRTISNEEFNNYQSNLNNLAEINKGYYKVFIFELSAFQDVDEVDFSGLKLTKNDIDNILKGEESLEVKSSMFSLLLAKKFEQNNVLFIINAYKENKLTIYPETILFKFIKKTPDFVVDKLI